MNIIIAGCGKVGGALAEQLSREGHDITVIDQRSAVIQHVTNAADVRGIVGNGASYNIQKDAGIEKADLLIAVTDADEVNLLCCLIAKKAGGCQTIARVRNPVYHQEISHIKEELGLSMIINPEWAAAMEIARLLRFPSAIEIDTFAGGRIELLRFRIDASNPLCRQQIKNISALSKCEVLICIVERDAQVLIPDGDMELKENDTISIVASPMNASRFFRLIGIETNQVKNTMIIGGGRLSFYLARKLLDMGIAVKIVEKNREICGELCELLPKAMIICGDGTDQEVLAEEGLAEALEFIIRERGEVTDIPLQNLELKSHMLVCAIHRNGKIIIPKGPDCLKAGDSVVIITTGCSELRDIRDILKKAHNTSAVR